MPVRATGTFIRDGAKTTRYHASGGDHPGRGQRRTTAASSPRLFAQAPIIGDLRFSRRQGGFFRPSQQGNRLGATRPHFWRD